MYAGTTFRHGSGRIVGVHQKIDRAARRALKRMLGTSVNFPPISKILHFEGKNGPDGIKRKSPSVDEPWHFINPADPDDHALVETISDHIYNLSVALKNNNSERSAFEAAWLAHAVVDGLTPAHHYPMDDKVEELWGKPHDERNSIKDKNIIHGDGAKDTISKNWEYWGAGGVITTHLKFETGSASAIATEKYGEINPTKHDLNQLNKVGFEAVYFDSVQRIDAMKIYDKFSRSGWTVDIANQVRRDLVPEMIRMVTLAWYWAAKLSKERK